MEKNDILMKLNIIKNAVEKGWCVEMQSDDTYILRKKISMLSNNEITTNMMIDNLLDIRKFKKI